MDVVFSAGKYLNWGVVSISVTNFLIIVLMIIVFILALLLPFPHGHTDSVAPVTADEPPEKGLQP